MFKKHTKRERDFFNCTFSSNSPCPAYQISLEDQQFHGIRTRTRTRHRKQQQQQHLGLGNQLTDMWIAMGWLESVSDPAATGTNQGSHVYNWLRTSLNGNNTRLPRRQIHHPGRHWKNMRRQIGACFLFFSHMYAIVRNES